MPQIQVIPAALQQPSFGSQLIESLGSGLSEGLSKGLSRMLERKAQVSKNKEAVVGSVSSLFKLLDPEKKFDEKSRENVFRRSRELVEQGFSPADSTFLAFEELNASSKASALKSSEQKEKAPKGFLPTSRDVKGGLAKGIRPFVELGQLPIEGINALEKAIESGASRVRQFLGGSPDQPIGAGPLKNIPPAINPFRERSPLQMYDEATGGRGIPGTKAERILSGFPLGLAGLGSKAIEEAAIGLGLPEQYAPFVGAAALPFGAKVQPQVLNSLMSLAKKLPGYKSVTAAAKTSGTSPETIVQEATSNLAERGVDLTNVAKGDAKAINEFQKEIKKTADTYKEAEQFHAKEALKRRAETAEKLKTSPLERYYKPKEGPKTEQGIAAEEARVTPLKERVKDLETEVKGAYRNLLNSENALKQLTKDTPQQTVDRIKSMIDLNRLNHSKLLNELNATEFTIRNRKPPMTSEEISTQIEDTFSKLREGIKNPSAEKFEDFRKRFAKDKEAIEAGEKLIQRGEIPGPKVFDEYIKIHEQYGKAYGDLVNELGEFIKYNESASAMKAKVANAKALRNFIKEVKKGNEAKIALQKDKRKALRALEKPSGAFFKNTLKDIRKDIDAFQRDLFRVNRIAHPEEVKVSQTAKKPLEKAKEIPKTIKDAAEAAKSPTKENISRLSQESGIRPEKLGDLIKQSNKIGEEAAAKIESGKATERDFRKTVQEYIKIYKKIPRIPKAIFNGVFLGSIQAGIEQSTGKKIPLSFIGFIFPKGWVGAARTAGVGYYVSQTLKEYFEGLEAEKLKKLRNTDAFTERLKDLRDRYSESKVNRIRKMAIDTK